jgi:HK97 family phage portal protein
MGFYSRVYKPLQPQTSPSYIVSSGGTTVSPRTAMEVAAYYRGLIYISTQIAKLPWYVKDRKRNKVDNRVFYLINKRPNNEMTAFSWLCFMIQQAIHTGNSFSEIERDVIGRPVAIWPIPTNHVHLLRDTQGKLWYRIIGGASGGGDSYLTPEDILHFKNFHTEDGITGMSLIAYAKETLGIAKGADILANSLMANGGMPIGVLKHPGRLNQESADRIKKQWKESHGQRRAGGLAVLEEGADYKAITLDPEVMQFIESRKFSVIELARFLGLPPTKLFDTENATYNNVEHANLEVATDTLDAWVRNLESEIDVKLLGNTTLESEMDIQSIFRGDMNTRATYFTKMMQAGAITPNQIREKEGEEPYAGGDRYYIATNNFTPQDRVDEVIDSQVKQKEESNFTKDNLDKEVVNYLRRNN